MKSEVNVVSSNTVYDNYKIYHPNGTLLSYVHKKRINWFLKRNLAVLIDEFSIKLLFEPNLEGRDFHATFKKENTCVKCGTTDNLSKHHIVPYCYIKYIDDLKFKGRNAYSIVLLCRTCHNEYEEIAYELKNEYINTIDAEKIKTIGFAVKQAITLYRHFNNMNSETFERMLLNVEKTFNVEIKSEQDIKDIIDIHKNNKKEKRSNLFSKEVIDKIINEGELDDFIDNWRLHFFKNVNPQYMPEGWKHMCDKLKIKYQIETPYLRCI